MAAVLAPHPTHAPARRPTLRLVDPADRPAVRPDPRPAPRSVVVPPRVRPTTATYWRRRFLVLLALTSIVVGAHALVSSATTSAGDDLALVTGSAPIGATAAPVSTPAAPAASEVYIVRPGDTVWSIASSLQPDGDVRALVDQLTERAGGSGLQAGQRIALDGLGR